MKALETTTVVNEDRQLILQLPQAVSVGEHRIVVLIDEPTLAGNHDEETCTPMRWEGNVLVYDGEYTGSLEEFVEELREERIHSFFPERGT
jgi:hypothetical protein